MELIFWLMRSYLQSELFNQRILYVVIPQPLSARGHYAVLSFGGKIRRQLKVSDGTDYLRDSLHRAGVQYSVLDEYQAQTAKRPGGGGL